MLNRVRNTRGAGDRQRLSRRRLLASSLGIGAAGAGASLLAPFITRPGGPSASAASLDPAGRYELLCRLDPATLSSIEAGGAGAPLVQPELRRAVHCVLETTLRARHDAAPVAGRSVTSDLYEGMFPGPMLRLRQGETLKVHLVNELDRATNLHFHGSHVSPSGNSDNIFVHVEPGETFTYQYDLPANHRSGLNWYHPHAHGTNENQVFGGMAGAIVVEGEIDDHPAITGLTERLLFLQGTSISPDGSTFDVNVAHDTGVTETYSARTINDVVTQLGAVEEWTLVNPSNDFHPFHIHINDIQTIAVNGEPVDNFGPEDTVLVPPRGGSMTMRTRFEDFTGRLVWHCHILRHEERGMMQVVEIRAPDGTPVPHPHPGHG